MIETYKIREGMHVQHCGDTSRNGWIGIVTDIQLSGRKLTVHYPSRDIWQEYTIEWFANYMMQLDAHHPSKPGTFWILWAPGSDIPPKIQHSSKREAFGVRAIMTQKYKKQFYVMQSCNTSTSLVHCEGNQKEDTMHEVKLLIIDDKIIEISDAQACILGNASKSYRVEDALRSGDNYYKSNPSKSPKHLSLMKKRKPLKAPSEAQKNASRRNWAVFQMRGNLALWANTCGDYGLAFNKEETQQYLLKAINRQYGFPEMLGLEYGLHVMEFINEFTDDAVCKRCGIEGDYYKLLDKRTCKLTKGE